MKLINQLLVSLLLCFSVSAAATETDLESSMTCVCEQYDFLGSNVFTGDPMTAVAGPWLAHDPSVQGYIDASQDPTVASFPVGVGLIGRAAASELGYDFSPNVQELPADKFLRLEAAKTHGIKGTVAILVAESTVVEFFTDQVLEEVDIEGIKSCF